MPLDFVGRRYADTLLTHTVEESSEKLQKDLWNLRESHAARGTTMSGLYITDHADEYIEQIRVMAEARLDSLLKAYEKSGMPLDEPTFHEIKDEVMVFCHEKQHHAVSAIGQIIQQAFQGSHPPGLQKAVSDRIINGVNGIMARLSRELSLK